MPRTTQPSDAGEPLGRLNSQAQSVERTETLRRRLLHLVLAGPPVPRTAVAELAEQTGWSLPERVTMVALRAPATPDLSELDNDVLADLGEPQPHLLIPGPLDEARRRMLQAALAGTNAAAGLTVPLATAADSLRWARRLLDLVDTDIVEDGPLVLCDDHLVTLWLLSDPALLDQLTERELAPVSTLTPTRRDRLIETLRIWLDTRGTAAQMGELLDVHPQTVRYRLRSLESIFGGRLTDPESRFATEIVLRAGHLRARAARVRRGAPGRSGPRETATN